MAPFKKTQLDSSETAYFGVDSEELTLLRKLRRECSRWYKEIKTGHEYIDPVNVLGVLDDLDKLKKKKKN